jgi:hypothetical protein
MFTLYVTARAHVVSAEPLNPNHLNPDTGT